MQRRASALCLDNVIYLFIIIIIYLFKMVIL